MSESTRTQSDTRTLPADAYTVDHVADADTAGLTAPNPVDRSRIVDVLRDEYGVTEGIPLDSLIQWSPQGIVLDVMVNGTDGHLLCHQDANGFYTEAVTVRKFYRHPRS